MLVLEGVRERNNMVLAGVSITFPVTFYGHFTVLLLSRSFRS